MPAASASPMPSDTSPSTIFLVLGSLMNLTVTGSRISRNRCTTKPAANGTVRVVARLVAERLVVARLFIRPPRVGEPRARPRLPQTRPLPPISFVSAASRHVQWIKREKGGKGDKRCKYRGFIYCAERLAFVRVNQDSLSITFCSSRRQPVPSLTLLRFGQ